MLDAVQRFPTESGSTPLLRGGEKRYEAEDGSICYIDPASGVPDPDLSYEYVTAFTYLHYQSIYSLNMAHVKLQPVCGTFPYSQIPTLYDYCLGMTGTLECLTQEHEALLQNYDFTRRTFLPSTFQKKLLEVKKTLVVYGSYDEYFKIILEDL